MDLPRLRLGSFRRGGSGSPATPDHMPENVPAHLLGTPEMWIAALRQAETKGDEKLCAYLEKALGALGPEAGATLRSLVLDPEESASLRARVLRALGHVSAEELGTAVDEILRLESRESSLFGEALRVLAGSGPTSVPHSVIHLARDSDAELELRSHALRAVMDAEPHIAESIFRSLVRGADSSGRQAAYGILGNATRPELAPLLQEILRDAPGKSTAGLIPALARMKGPEWGNVQMTGAPDTPTAGDSATAWASKKEKEGVVTVEVDFATEVMPEQVRVHETFGAGAIVRIEARGRTGEWATLWAGPAQAAQTPRWFTPPLAMARDRFRTIRLLLDTDKVSGWNEIDAVELVGDGLRQWAAAARSSSCYADGR